MLLLLCYLVEDTLLLTDVAGVVVLHQVVVQLRRVIVPHLAKLAPRVPRLSQLGVTLFKYRAVQNRSNTAGCIKKAE